MSSIRNDVPVLDPSRLAQEMAQRGEAWADADAAANALEETRQWLYSSIAAEYLSNGESAAKAELLAKGDQRYKQHLDAMVMARKAANKARVKYDTWRIYAENMRSLESSRRAEMGMR